MSKPDQSVSEVRLDLEEAFKAAYFMTKAYIGRGGDEIGKDLLLYMQFLHSDPARWSYWIDAVQQAIADAEGVADPH